MTIPSEANLTLGINHGCKIQQAPEIDMECLMDQPRSKKL